MENLAAPTYTLNSFLFLLKILFYFQRFSNNSICSKQSSKKIFIEEKNLSSYLF
jgi:hypothetical protein